MQLTDSGRDLVTVAMNDLTHRFTVDRTVPHRVGDYVNGSLRDLVLEGAGTPNAFEGPEVLALAKQGRSAR